MKALMFGGAFNPPTKAHIDLAYCALKQCGRDKVIFVPSKMQYIRDDQKKNFAFTDAERLDMLKRISGNRDWMCVSDYELCCESQPRTYTTLKYLKSTGYDCSLLFGSDKLAELETGWRHVPEIAEEFGIVCMSRNADSCRTMIRESTFLHNIAQYITVVDTPDEYRDISSTKVRGHFLAARDEIDEISRMIPEELNGLKEYL